MQEISTDQREESEVNVQGNSNDIEINENIKERLIWSKLDVREKFKTYKFLPYFMGCENEIVHKVRQGPEDVSTSIDVSSSKVDSSESHPASQNRQFYKTVIEKVKLLPLPALLWKDQAIYLKSQEQALNRNVCSDEDSRSAAINTPLATKRKREDDEHSTDEIIDNAVSFISSDDGVKSQKRRRSSFPVIDGLLSWFQSDEKKEDHRTPLQDLSVIGFFSNLFFSPSPVRSVDDNEGGVVMEVNEEKEESANDTYHRILAEDTEKPEETAIGWKEFPMDDEQVSPVKMGHTSIEEEEEKGNTSSLSLPRSSSSERKKIKRNKSDRIFRDREEWFHYQVFQYLQHYKVMNHPIPLYHSIAPLIERNQRKRDTVTFIKPKTSKRKENNNDKDQAAYNHDQKEAATEEEEESAVEGDRSRENKYLIGPGDNYGGDFTLYQGVDTPSEGHSVATIRVLYSNKMSALNLLAFSRVQNKVAKAAIVAFPSSELKSLDRKIDLSDNGNEDEEERVHFLMFNFRDVALRAI